VLIQRVVTAGVFGVAVVGSILLLPSIWTGLVLGAFWLLGAREWARFAKLGNVASIAYVASNAVLMVAAARLLDATSFVEVVLLAAAIWWLLAAIMLLNYPQPLSSPFSIVAGLMTLQPCWALLSWLHAAIDDGRYLILVLLAIVWSADTGAFFAGRALGRHRLAPQISPGKTWEGVIGGLLLAAVVGAAAGALTGYGAAALGLVAVPTAAVSVLGDLTVSMFKRNAGLKDSGRLLPGHGGVLDRIDSITPATAMFVLGLLLVGIIT